MCKNTVATNGFSKVQSWRVCLTGKPPPRPLQTGAPTIILELGGERGLESGKGDKTGKSYTI
jgi:hypothetical protein